MLDKGMDQKPEGRDGGIDDAGDPSDGAEQFVHVLILLSGGLQEPRPSSFFSMEPRGLKPRTFKALMASQGVAGHGMG